jgi:hypothetical protein
VGMGEKKEGDVELHVEKASGKVHKRVIDEPPVRVQDDFRSLVMNVVNSSAGTSGIAKAEGYPAFYNDVIPRLVSIQAGIEEQAKKAQAKEAQERSITHKVSRAVWWVICAIVSTLIAFAVGYLMPH